MDITRRLIGIGAAVFLLVLAGLSLKWGMGHALLEPWMIENSRAAREGRWMEADVIASGRTQIDKALRWHDRADGHELLGHYSLAAAAGSNGLQHELRKARDEFEAAIALRPSMPYSWAHLAATQYRLGMVDARFFQALQQAQRLGPWEPAVHAIVADFGLAVLDEAPAEVKNAVLGNVQRGLVHQGELMLELARKRGKLGPVCALRVPEKLRRQCEKRDASS